MKKQTFRAFSPLLLASALFASPLTQAQTPLTPEANQGTTVTLTATVNREVDKDVMEAVLFSRQTGKSLPALRNQVSKALNPVLEQAKKLPQIEVQSNGVSSNPNYNDKGKLDGWLAEGRIQLKSKDFEAMATILENLGENVALESVYFGVSPEKIASVEDEMTLELLTQLQHKASVVQKGLQAKGFAMQDVNFSSQNQPAYYEARAVSLKAAYADNQMPLESGKATISSSATGKVKFD